MGAPATKLTATSNWLPFGDASRRIVAVSAVAVSG
jgi:hypothetical protein